LSVLGICRVNSLVHSTVGRFVDLLRLFNHAEHLRGLLLVYGGRIDFLHFFFGKHFTVAHFNLNLFLFSNIYDLVINLVCVKRVVIELPSISGVRFLVLWRLNDFLVIMWHHIGLFFILNEVVNLGVIL